MKDSKKLSISKIYAKLAKKLKREVKLEDLKAAGVTKDMVTHHFGSLVSLDKTSRTDNSANFHDVPVDHLYSQQALVNLRKDVSSYSRFVITTAVNGADVHDGFYASIKKYCDLNDAALLVIVASDPAAANTRNKWGTISSKLQHETIVLEDTRINDNVFISTIKLSAKHIDPTTGLGRIGQRNGTFIYASPKQRLKAVPISNTKLPHFMMTTGAITVADYETDNYMTNRTSYIANHDHVLGAIIVERVDNQSYHFRQIQADSKGRFIDLGLQYSENGTKEVRPEAFVLGDWHAGETDPSARRAWEEVINLLKPKKLVLHDAFDGLSINHHEEHQGLLKAKRAQAGQLNLEAELACLADDLNYFTNLVDEVVVVKSNHDQFLERYLQEGKYVKDPHNHKVSLEIALAMLNGNDPLKYAVGMSFPSSDPKWKKVRWLGIDDDFRIEGIQCGAHGHLGANGARGSLMAMEAAYGNSVSGHSHTPEILRGCFQVGTSSHLKLTYNKGASSWLHCSCLIYPGGQRQLINSIDGEWRLESK